MKKGRKYVLKNKLRFSVFLMVLAVAGFILFIGNNVYGQRQADYRLVPVMKGDTLWGIAKAYCEDGDIREYIYEIKKANQMNGSDIFPGTWLKIPEK